MPSVERSAGAIVFRRVRGQILYLILHYGGHGHWDFPKGHIEKGEKTEETVRREVREETGIRRLKIFPRFKKTIRYSFWDRKRRVLKFVAFFLAQTPQKKVTLSHEHADYQWLAYPEALEQVTFATGKALLKKAHMFLDSKKTK